MTVIYDYSKLRGLIKEYFETMKNFANYLGVSETSLNLRLQNKLPFKQDEIYKSLIGFKKNGEDLDKIFFCNQLLGKIKAIFMMI